MPKRKRAGGPMRNECRQVVEYRAASAPVGKKEVGQDTEKDSGSIEGSSEGKNQRALPPAVYRACARQSRNQFRVNCTPAYTAAPAV